MVRKNNVGIYFIFLLLFNCSCCEAYYTRTLEGTAYEYNLYEGNGITAFGERCVPYKTVAIDPNFIKPYSVLVFDYAGYRFSCIATDTGSAIKGWKFDFALATTGECIAFGRRHINVKIYDPGEYKGNLGWVKLK